MKTEATNYQPTTLEPKLERVLVVISPDLVKPGAPQNSILIARAIALAKATGCELEFFHVCHDDTLSKPFFADADDLRREQEKCLDRDAMLMAELVLHLNSEGVSIKHDTRWDAPRTDAILRKINESQPDLVMKQSREYGYVMGLMSNTDWDLIRKSPAHLWFVTEDGSNKIDRLVTAVGANLDEDEMIAAADYNVFRMANLIAEGFGAENIPVHAYQVPVGLSTYGIYAPELGGIAGSTAGPVLVEETRREIARNHGRSIEAFALFFGLEPERVQIVEGHPSDVLPEAAKSMAANLIVMAARNLSRWERLSQSVTAEPVLAEAPCDVLFIKDARDTLIPVADEYPKQGNAAYDLELAITDPQRAFDSPQTLVHAPEISLPMKKRILQLWEQDIRAQMAEENEGGPIRATNAAVLDAINVAKANLTTAFERNSDAHAELTR